MIKKYRGFLESTNINFIELEGLIEKEIEYLNLVNDIVQRYEDEYGLQYEFDKEVLFYNLREGVRQRDFSMRKIIDNNSEIDLDRDSSTNTRSNTLLKDILKSPTSNMRCQIFLYGDSLGYLSKQVVDKIVDEIGSQYPFTTIVKDPLIKGSHLQLSVDINDIRDNI